MPKASQQIGPYEILGVVGAGGMGIVYRARDTRLDRQVAIKVLLPDVASNEDALARFEREARAVAALSHPNILAIHDFGRDGESVYAVMEFLDGRTLRAMIEDGALSVRKAVTLAVQIAQGLAAAHDRHIVHRDLKPENIGLMRTGQVKILDFGLAREVLRHATRPDAPTGTYFSDPGMVLGTVGYMSPEQVRGQEVDHRSDLFAFGVVLYEMITGRRAFMRATAADTLTAILNEEPADLVDSGAKVPPALDRVIRRCLEKHPEDRFHSARDLAFALENALSGSGSPDVLPAGRRLRRGLARTALVVLSVAAGAGLGYFWRPASDPPSRVRQLTLSGRDNEPSASADGTVVAYTSTRGDVSGIWTRQVNTGTEELKTTGHRPRFFAEELSLLFLRSEGNVERAWRVPLLGGIPEPLVSDVVEADPSPDGREIAFARLGANPDGTRFARLGVLEIATKHERFLLDVHDAEFASVRWSPDGGRIAAVQRATVGGRTDIVIVDGTPGRPPHVLTGLDAGAYGALAWNGDGRSLIVTRAENAQVYVPGVPARVESIDIDTGRRQTLLFAPNLFGLFGSTDANGTIEVLGDGRLVFSSVEAHQNLRDVPLGPRSVPGRKGAGTIGNSHDRQPAYSRDGQFVIFSSNRSGDLDLWIQSTRTGEIWQLTSDPAQDWDPAFAPDGKHVLWSCNKTGHLEIWMADFDGTRLGPGAGPGALTGKHPVTSDGFDAENPTMAPGSDWIVYYSGNPARSGIWRVKPDGSQATRLVAGAFVIPDVSPDGRCATYLFADRVNLRNTVRVVDVESGRDQNVAIAVPYRPDESSADITWARARWTPDGRSIVFIGQDATGRAGVYMQDFVPGQDTATTRRRVVDSLPGAATESLGVSPDGWITVSDRYDSRNLMLAEHVPGVVGRPRGK